MSVHKTKDGDAYWTSDSFTGRISQNTNDPVICYGTDILQVILVLLSFINANPSDDSRYFAGGCLIRVAREHRGSIRRQPVTSMASSFFWF